MKRKSQFRLLQFRWLFLVDLGLVIGGVMAFGSVASRWFHMDRGNAIFMLGMIPAMMIVVGLSTAIIMKVLRKKWESCWMEYRRLRMVICLCSCR